MTACFIEVCKKAIQSWSCTLIMKATTHTFAAFYPSEKVIRSLQTPTVGEGNTQEHDSQQVGSVGGCKSAYHSRELGCSESALLPGPGSLLAQWTEVARGDLSALGRFSGPRRARARLPRKRAGPNLITLLPPEEARALLWIVLLPLYCPFCL